MLKRLTLIALAVFLAGCCTGKMALSYGQPQWSSGNTLRAVRADVKSTHCAEIESLKDEAAGLRVTSKWDRDWFGCAHEICVQELQERCATL